MKKVLTIILLACMLGLTGCMHMAEITDEESETIARTAAWLLFKYDNNYTENLITPTPTVTSVPASPTPTAYPPVTDSTQSQPTGTPSGDTEGAVSETLVLPEHNCLPETLIGTEGVRLVCDGYELYDSYTFDSFSVEPKKPDNCLMLVFIQLQNKSTEPVPVNILELQPKCRLYADVTKQLSPKRTVLLNDFQYLITEIPAGESYNSVLVFEVEKGFAPESMDLYLSVGENTAHLSLQ